MFLLNCIVCEIEQKGSIRTHWRQNYEQYFAYLSSWRKKRSMFGSKTSRKLIGS
jgi:hypothetical protein